MSDLKSNIINMAIIWPLIALGIIEYTYLIIKYWH